MLNGTLKAATAFVILQASLIAFAARLVEKRESATHVFTGKVTTLHLQKNNGFLNYTVDVAVTSIEKGDGIKTGDVVPVECYLRDPDWLKDPARTEEERRYDYLNRDSSYRAVPREGDEIRVYARKSLEKFNGIYPDWFDVVKK
jgi:hypothetical protein